MTKIECCIMGLQGAMANYLSQSLGEYHQCIQLNSRDISALVSHLEYRFNPQAKQHTLRPFVILDFTHPQCTQNLLDQIGDRFPVHWVIGTSGLSNDIQQQIRTLGESSSVFWSSNFSLGAAIQNYLTHTLGQLLGQQGQASILDFHNTEQTEDFSATAHALQHAWEGGAGSPAHMTSVRVGDGISEHTLFATLPGERLELTHRLLDQKAFLAGVRLAITKVVQEQHGLFDMRDLFQPASEHKLSTTL